MAESAAGKGRDKVSIVVGFILLALAGVLWSDAVSISRTVSYGVGPAVMPKIIAVGLIILGGLSILQGFRSEGVEAEEADFGPVGLIILGFLALTALIGFGAGFIVAMTVLFVVTSYAFGRRSISVDTGIGLVLSALIYLLFSKILTLSLPQGPLERLFG